MKYFFIAVFLCCVCVGFAQTLVPTNFAENSPIQATASVGQPAALPAVMFHLPARPWRTVNISRQTLLDRVESLVRATVQFQDPTGAIIDPYLKREVQYATPYFAYAVGTLLSAGRAADLIPAGIAAMNRATAAVWAGAAAIPDNHGEFFIAPLTKAIPLYLPFVTATQAQIWKSRMTKPISEIIRGQSHNWRTYAMKGEWSRVKGNYVSRSSAISWLENSWKYTQKGRFTNNTWRFYHDDFSDPLPWAYEAVSRSNLLAMIADGYNGISKTEMLTILQSSTNSNLLVQDPSGQEPAGGRSSNHTWNDLLMADAFDALAELTYREGDHQLAGQYRRAAALGYKSIERWLRPEGTYSITKNHFPHERRVRYASYSHFSSYSGNMMYHLAEGYLRARTSIPEVPAPNEIGGYTLVTDGALATAVANAGGMHMQVGLRGSTEVRYNNYWSALGITRFARTGWDSRLGPSDGIRENASRLGVSFAPTFLEGGTWLRMASIPDRYAAVLTTQFVHPLLVRCRLTYQPRAGKTGPVFTNDFVVTPDGILSTLTSTAGVFGITWPLLTSDGSTSLLTSITGRTASTRFPGQTDQQNFISLHSAPTISASDATRRSSYGDLRPVRMVSGSDSNFTFVYPRSAEDPDAEMVRKSFRRTGNNFTYLLGKVQDSLYIGRTSAGGHGTAIDINGDGLPEATFTTATGFLMQLHTEEITRMETDKDVSVLVYGQALNLKAYTPIDIKNPYKLTVGGITASTNDGNIPVNTVDRNYATRWSAYGTGQWIQFRLDSVATLQAAKIAWFRGNERQYSFTIQTSLDSVLWETVFSGHSSGTTLYAETVPVSPRPALFVRIRCNGNNINRWNAITEVLFFSDGKGYLQTAPAAITGTAPKLSAATVSAPTENDALQIVPNPATGVCVVTFQPQWIGAELVVNDMSGITRLSQIVRYPNLTLDLSGFPKGTYLISLRKNEKVVHNKVVKQ